MSQVKTKNEVYKCAVCGNVVEVNHAGGGELVCCDQPMDLLKENTEDAATEKHVPVIEKVGNKIKVKIGEVEHPMEDKHYIEWIELLINGKSYCQFLEPGQKPEAVFTVEASSQVIARAYCNLHGLWKAEINL